MHEVPFGGWRRCARLASNGVEALVTLEVGPRVIRFAREGGPNMLAEYPGQMGLVGGVAYRSYGGHRLWVAPEDAEVTYESDNDPVQALVDGDTTWFSPPPGSSGLRREIGVDFRGPALVVRHRIINLGGRALRIAPWALTVMAPGGECAFPQSRPQSHSEALLPVRAMALWAYTDMADPRWTWGRRAIRLRQRAEPGPQKVGAMVEQGIAVYALNNEVFVKRFPFDPKADYPDFGCNFETFTRQDMLEVESLGGLAVLAPGARAEHTETWYLIQMDLPSTDLELGELLDRLADECPLL